jgi:hypothetical protein
MTHLYSTITSKRGSASDECQKVRIDHVGMGGHHAVGEARVNLQLVALVRSACKRIRQVQPGDIGAPRYVQPEKRKSITY